MSVRFLMKTATVAGSLVAMAACSKTTQSSTQSAPQPAASKVAALPDGVTAQMVAVGDSIFKTGSCQRCHGRDAKGTDRGVDLTDNQWVHISGSYPEIVQIITEGVPKEKIKLATAQFPMRPRGGSNMTDEQIRNVAAYVYSISHH